MIQTRTQQRKIIETAMADGSLSTLLWYMVSDIGGGKTRSVAVYKWIPVVRVGPDPAVTEHDAHLMLELARHYAPTLLLRLEITAVDILNDAGVTWFEWGSEDVICPMCAGIGWDSCCCQPSLWVVSEGNHEGINAGEEMAALETKAVVSRQDSPRRRGGSKGAHRATCQARG